MLAAGSLPNISINQNTVGRAGKDIHAEYHFSEIGRMNAIASFSRKWPE
jgi:hypothetical protein